MAWFNIQKAPLTKNQKCEPPEGLWYRCGKCGEIIFRKDFVANQHVCTQCNFHNAIPAMDRILSFLDADSFVPYDCELSSCDPLDFKDRKPYATRLKEAQGKTGHKDAILTGEGRLHERSIQIGVMEFGFMAGSMGTVVGEKLQGYFAELLRKKCLQLFSPLPEGQECRRAF